MKVKLTVTKVPDIGELTLVPVELNYSGSCPFFKASQEIIVGGEGKPDCQISEIYLVNVSGIMYVGSL